MCGVRVGHHGPLEHDILKEDCCYHTTLAGFVYNPFAGNQQGTRLTKRRRGNTGSLKRRMLSNAV